jgi:urease accessory protein
MTRAESLVTPMRALLDLLHLCDSLFPIGSFSYSDGLETATSGALVHDLKSLREWLDVCLDESIGRSDGPALTIAWSALHRSDWGAFVAVDEQLTALRPSSTSRAANRSMGWRLLKTWQALHPDVRLEHALELVAAPRQSGPTLPVAFAAVNVCAGIDRREGLAGYAYTRLGATVSAAMRLIPLGQTDAHQLLSQVLDRVPAMVDDVIARNPPIESFAPALDVAQMTQQYVHSRLFRS